MGFDLVVRARRVVTPEGERAGAVAVVDGRVVAVEPYDARPAARQDVELAADEVLLPGLVDTHVHVNEPGRTEWEGFATATRAAAAGGVTTILDMPLNSVPPTVDVDALDVKRAAADGRLWVDTGFWGGAVPGNTGNLHALHDAGVFGFKCFLADSGVTEFGHLPLDRLEPVMRAIASFGGTLIVHAEDAAVLAAAPPAGGRSYDRFLRSRPRAAEDLAIARVVELAAGTGCRTHVLHLSSADAIPVLADARRDGVPVSVETCPHYLTFAAEDIPDGATQYKCCPPIREADNRERLWQGLLDGVVDAVVSDHSPSTVDLKCLDSGDFGTAWGGISSLQLGVSAVWTGAARRGLGLVDVARWLAEAPASLAGLDAKGRIAVGADADFCVLAPDDTFTVDAAALHHKNPLTPYAGRELRGVVRSTWLRGEPVQDDPHGRMLTRAAEPPGGRAPGPRRS